ncbi:hypothetical protein GOP47_0029291 [Adiantum capillus-veneris]|nr:hypothetical protein GOP47_0029291 [Adiantum capillus-veneris]
MGRPSPASALPLPLPPDPDPSALGETAFPPVLAIAPLAKSTKKATERKQTHLCFRSRLALPPSPTCRGRASSDAFLCAVRLGNVEKLGSRSLSLGE